MRHRKKKKLAKGYNLDRQMLKGLAASLILYEKITTTEKRGKLLRSEVERLITKGKVSDLHKKRQLFASLPKNAARKVFEVLGPKYQERNGGYTRLTRFGKMKDGTPKVVVELV